VTIISRRIFQEDGGFSRTHVFTINGLLRVDLDREPLASPA
jgi:hypothetical protein